MNNGSNAFLTLLMSYEQATETIQFHFNMKEPGRQGSAYLAESDIQFNTHLDLRTSEDQKMVNEEKS